MPSHMNILHCRSSRSRVFHLFFFIHPTSVSNKIFFLLHSSHLKTKYFFPKEKYIPKLYKTEMHPSNRNVFIFSNSIAEKLTNSFSSLNYLLLFMAFAKEQRVEKILIKTSIVYKLPLFLCGFFFIMLATYSNQSNKITFMISCFGKVLKLK